MPAAHQDFNRRVRNIAWAIQDCRRSGGDDTTLLQIFEVTALRWLYKPMTGNDMYIDEISHIIEQNTAP